MPACRTRCSSTPPIRFTAVLHAKRPKGPARPVISGASARLVWEALAGGDRTIAELEVATGLEYENVRRILGDLRKRDLVDFAERRTKPARYRRVGD